jgi:hypothetical protein
MCLRRGQPARSAGCGRTVTRCGGPSTGWKLPSERAWPLPMLVSLLAFIIVGVIVLCVGKVAYRALDRRRLADWEADWQAIEPQWSGRR